MKVGDVVRLKGNERKMTVMEFYGESCKVVWFDSKGDLQHAIFDQRALEKVPEE